MDLTKLTPAPWDAGFANDDAAFCALARNAFDVLIRRPGWYPKATLSSSWSGRDKIVWFVYGVAFPSGSKYDMAGHTFGEYDDPFTALVEADKWYAQNVES